QAMLPRFNEIQPTKIEPTLRALFDDNRKALNALLTNTQSYTWENLMQPLEDMGDQLHRYWSPISHLHATMETDALRDAYNQVLPILTEYHTEISQNETLF